MSGGRDLWDESRGQKERERIHEEGGRLRPISMDVKHSY